MADEHRTSLRVACEAAYPRECCGLLLGSRHEIRLIVRRVVSTLNAVSTTGGFAIPDHEMRRGRRLATGWGLQILAVFHSHPSGSVELSSSDRAALAHSEWPWVILTQNTVTREIRLTWFANG